MSDPSQLPGQSQLPGVLTGDLVAVQLVRANTVKSLCKTCADETADGECCECCNEHTEPGYYLTIRLDDDHASIRSTRVAVIYLP